MAITVENLGKAYKVYDRPRDMLKEIVFGGVYHRRHWALRDITFEVARGSIVGVVGRNGAGKSTLLRIIAGLLEATTGTVRTNGILSAILELGTGFHPDLSGRENILTGGMCLGMNREEIEQKLPWIIEFSELGSVIDQPFRTYSSGMQARLTFSTAISVDPEIFIVDEALAAGDGYFVNKCLRRIKEICTSGATVFFASHSTYLVLELCEKAIWIEAGQVAAFGPSYEVVKAYEKSVLEETNRAYMKLAPKGLVSDKSPVEPKQSPASSALDKATYVVSKEIEVTAVSLHAKDGTERYVFATGEEMFVRAEWRGTTKCGNIGVGLRIDSRRTQGVAGYTSDEDGVFLNDGRPLEGNGTFEIVMQAPNFGQGEFHITVSIKEVDFTGGDGTLLFIADRVLAFNVHRKKKYPHEYICELNFSLRETSQNV